MSGINHKIYLGAKSNGKSAQITVDKDSIVSCVGGWHRGHYQLIERKPIAESEKEKQFKIPHCIFTVENSKNHLDNGFYMCFSVFRGDEERTNVSKITESRAFNIASAMNCGSTFEEARTGTKTDLL